MLHLTWKIFSETGSIDTYLLYKELEKEYKEKPNSPEELAEEVESSQL